MGKAGDYPPKKVTNHWVRVEYISSCKGLADKWDCFVKWASLPRLTGIISIKLADFPCHLRISTPPLPFKEMATLKFDLTKHRIWLAALSHATFAESAFFPNKIVGQQVPVDKCIGLGNIWATEGWCTGEREVLWWRRPRRKEEEIESLPDLEQNMLIGKAWRRRFVADKEGFRMRVRFKTERMHAAG